MKARTLFVKLVRAMALAGIGVIVLMIVAVGGFQVLIAQLPGYQAQLKSWVDTSLGLTLDFDKMDLRWGLHGPELAFHNVSLSTTDDPRAFLVAREVSVIVDPWLAVTRRQVRIGRLSLAGTRLTVVRDADGKLHLLGAPAEHSSQLNLATLIPSDIEIAVRDSTLTYVDASHGVEWRFGKVAADLKRTRDVLEFKGGAVPPRELGTSIELDAETRLETGQPTGLNGRLFADLHGVHLETLASAFPAEAAIPSSGSGNLGVWLEWRFGHLKHALIQTSLDQVAWTPPGSVAEHAVAAVPANSPSRRTGGPYATNGTRTAQVNTQASAIEPDSYDHLSLSAEWFRSDDGWRLTLDDIDLRRMGRAWPRAADAAIRVTKGAHGDQKIEVSTDFVRLEDLTPLIRTLPQSAFVQKWLELDPQGELFDVKASLGRQADAWVYSGAGRFERLGIDANGAWPGFDGLSGELRADMHGGRVTFNTRDAGLDWRQLFPDAFSIGELSGVVVWRQGFDGLHVLSDTLLIANADATTHSNLELVFPADGASPELDMQTRVGPFDVVAAKHYLPVHKMPAAAVRWLNGALQGGRSGGGEVSFTGPIEEFPFDAGGGKFKAVASLENGVLDYADGWPRAVDLDGQVEFVNASFNAHAKGRVLGNVSQNVRVAMPDLRNPELQLKADTNGSLASVFAFLQGASPIAQRLGPGYELLHAPAGRGHVHFDLDLPFKDRDAYTLNATLQMADATLTIDGFEPRVTELDGTLSLSNDRLVGKDLRAVFLDGPVTAQVKSPLSDKAGYRSQIDFDGEVTADAVATAFHLPLKSFVAGQTRWQGQLLIPSQAEGGASNPLVVHVTSNLSGVASNFPPPFSKTAAEPLGLGLDITLPDSSHVDISGHLGSTRRFVLNLADTASGKRLIAGGLQFGGAAPAPLPRGFTIAGTLPVLDFDAWTRAVVSGSLNAGADRSAGRNLANVDLSITDFQALGQRLGTSRLQVAQNDSAWIIDLDSQPIAGHIVVPRDFAAQPPIVADMERLSIQSGDGLGTAIDPRTLTGLSLKTDDLVLGPRHFGRAEAEIRREVDGLRLVSFKSQIKGLSVLGSGSWLEGKDGTSTTQLSLQLKSSDVAAALADLALDPIAKGKSASIKASVEWPGPPTANWMDHVGGQLSLELKEGSLLDIDPGAGRVVGLMSITALPRRLALDFRDVFSKGLVFDKIKGDFKLIDGNAYTNNLKVESPAADIGIAGRVGLRDHDYRQQVMVSTEPGKILPTVGGLIGGPAVGAALLLFTRIFKEPLKGVGRASYCVTGSWDAPNVERLGPGDRQHSASCADLPPGGLAPAEKGIDGTRRAVTDE